MLYCFIDIKKFDQINSSLWTKEKADALFIYSQLLQGISFNNSKCVSKLSYDVIKDHLQNLMSKYGYFYETFQAMLLFFHYSAKTLPQDVIFVYEVFSQWMRYFANGPYRSFVINSMIEYITKLKLPDGTLDYVYFANDLLYYGEIDKIPQEISDDIQNKRDKNFLQMVDDALEAGQIVYAIKKCLQLYSGINITVNSSKNKKSIKIATLKKIIVIYKKLKISPLVKKYEELLKKIT